MFMIILYRILIIITCCIVGYLFGSIPNSVIIGKIYHKDPREYGSKNPGGTNVGRVISHFAGALTIFLDALKVVIPMTIIWYLTKYYEPFINLMNGNNLVYNWYGFGNSLTDLCYYLVPLFCFIGHSYSCFIKFKGGKIVSTVVGLMFATTYLALPIFIVIFFISLKTSKYVSLSSMIMSSSFMIFTWIVYLIYLLAGYNPQISNYLMYFSISGPISIFYPIIATLGNILLIYKHRENIKRLINKTESKVKWIDNIGKNKNSD